MDKRLLLTHLFNGVILIRFAISKLMAWPISVAAFIEMAKPLGIDPTFFRISTGILVSVVIALYFSCVVLLIKKSLLQHPKARAWGIFSNLVGIGFSLGALFSEFFLREAPKVPLVIIASVIILFSIFNVRVLWSAQTQRALS